MIGRTNSGGGGGEAHGAIIAGTVECNNLATVELSLNGEVIRTVKTDEIYAFGNIQTPGTYTITATEGDKSVEKTATVTSDNIIYKQTVTVDTINLIVIIVSFSDGTDEQIANMVQAHYDNIINLSDYWAVGDTRSVSLSAMPATGVGESHRAQTVQFVIGGFEHDDLTTSINGHSKAAVTLLQKDCLMDANNASNPVNGSTNIENGYINSSNSNESGWKSCERRTWCNNVYYKALPSAWKSMVKTVNKKTSLGSTSHTIETVQDNIFLASEIEIFGLITFSAGGEGAQYQYYKNATANRDKMPKWSPSRSTSSYFERSPYTQSYNGFCIVTADGGKSFDSPSTPYGIAPCFCI